eukprot:TRINITY_DN20928_c0_g2_i2.p1 TRINITY_DN20928_c0_g2~~TRINITY_DN20928_c0_g2_i2.p1  ORF type:complete len:200 (-),score=9.96 TRINITY_DN20928_c0_g2_i2:212-745(-)
MLLNAAIEENKPALTYLLEKVKHSRHLVEAVQSFPQGAEGLVEHIGLTLSQPNQPEVIAQDLALAFWNLYQQNKDPKWTIPTVPYISEVLVLRERESQLVKEWTTLDKQRFNFLLQRLYSGSSLSSGKGWAILPQDLIFNFVMISNDPQFQPLNKVTQAILMCLSQNWQRRFQTEKT